DHRNLRDLPDEAREQEAVRADAGAPALPRGLPEPGEVDGDDAAALGEPRRDRDPVQQRTAQAVDAHERERRRPGPLPIVDRAVEIEVLALGKLERRGHAAKSTGPSTAFTGPGPDSRSRASSRSRSTGSSSSS